MNRLEAEKFADIFSREYSELDNAGYFDAFSTYSGQIGCDVIELLDVLRKQNHSGFSYGLTVHTLYRLSKCLPLTPLTGEDDEWEYIATKTDDNGGELDIYCNKRYPPVKMYRCPATGKETCVNTQYRAYSTDGGKSFSYRNNDSHEIIMMPYWVPDEPVKVILKNDPFGVYGGLRP